MFISVARQGPWARGWSQDGEVRFSNRGSWVLDGYTQRGSERTVSKSTLFNYMNTKDRVRTKRERDRDTRERYTLPSPGMMRRVTVLPASLMRLTMSEWDLLVMEHPFTAKIRSPTFSLPHRSAGLPSIIRPILWGMATHALPALIVSFNFFFFNVTWE